MKPKMDIAIDYLRANPAALKFAGRTLESMAVKATGTQITYYTWNKAKRAVNAMLADGDQYTTLTIDYGNGTITRRDADGVTVRRLADFKRLTMAGVLNFYRAAGYVFASKSKFNIVLVKAVEQTQLEDVA